MLEESAEPTDEERAAKKHMIEITTTNYAGCDMSMFAVTAETGHLLLPEEQGFGIGHCHDGVVAGVGGI